MNRSTGKGIYMSESVKIGGIRKNPAIDKINRLDSMDVKNMAKYKMEKLLQSEDFARNEICTRQVPINFGKANWKSS